MRTPLLLLGLLSALLPAAAIIAQPAPPPPRTVTFLYWSQANPPSGLSVLPAGARAASSLDLYPFTRSAPVVLGATATSVELRVRPPAQPPGAPARPDVTLLKTALPADVTSATIVVFPGENASAPWQSIVLRDDLERFPAASARVINLTPYALAARLGGRIVQLDPGMAEAVILTPADMLRVKLVAALRVQDQWLPPAATNANSPTTGRVLFLVGSSNQSTMIDPQSPPVPGARVEPRIVALVDIPPKPASSGS